MTATVRLDVLDLAAAPEQPGIYAWYLEPPMFPSPDQPPSDFAARISELASALREAELRLVASGRFGNRWGGSLPAEGGTLDSALSSSSSDTVLSKGLTTPTHRAAFTQLLRAAVPQFSAPVYIGVAGNLRRRLETHGKALTDPELQDQEGEDVEVARNFAERCKRANAREDHLVVYAMPVPLAALDQGEAREVAAAAELVLNGVYRPLFGRR